MCCVRGELGSSECCAPGTEVVSAADSALRYRRSTSSHKPHRCHLRESRATRYIMQVDHQDDEARSCAHAGTFQPIHVVYYVRLGSRLKGLWDWHGLDGRSRAPMAWFHQRSRFHVAKQTSYEYHVRFATVGHGAVPRGRSRNFGEVPIRGTLFSHLIFTVNTSLHCILKVPASYRSQTRECNTVLRMCNTASWAVCAIQQYVQY